MITKYYIYLAVSFLLIVFTIILWTAIKQKKRKKELEAGLLPNEF